MNALAAVDPGVRGAISVIDEDGVFRYVRAFDPTMTHFELVQVVEGAVLILHRYDGHEALCERVGYMPGDGGKGAFTFGQVNGLIRGALHALNVAVYDVSPVIWQSHMGCLSGGNKNVTKNKAIELFGKQGIKITHAVADSMLIAEHGRRKILGREK